MNRNLALALFYRRFDHAIPTDLEAKLLEDGIILDELSEQPAADQELTEYQLELPL